MSTIERKQLIYMAHNMLSMRVKILAVTMTFFCIIASGCRSSQVTFMPMPELEPALKEAITNYYELEKKEQWVDVYMLRDDKFRDVVPLDLYLMQMKKNNAGWKLLEFTITGAEKKRNDTVLVRIKFIEKSNIGRKIFGRITNNMEITQTTKWIKEDGKWYCKEPGSRTHLSLNNELVPDDEY